MVKLLVVLSVIAFSLGTVSAVYVQSRPSVSATLQAVAWRAARIGPADESIVESDLCMHAYKK